MKPKNESKAATAEKADAVIAITMFHSLAVGWADLVLPGTAALEREGTAMNLEGRVPPVWINLRRVGLHRQGWITADALNELDLEILFGEQPLVASH